MDVNVAAAEYQRLPGYPREHTVDGRAAELAAWARGWHTMRGNPWMAV